MDVSAPQDLLQRSLSQVSRAVATKTTYPVLSNVLIEAVDDSLKLAATNQEIGISTSKLHAFGPMGLDSLTSKKWIVYGEGQVRG